MQKIILVLFIAFWSCAVYGQQLSTKDSITVFYDSLFYQLENHYLHRDSVKWKNLKPFILEQVLEASSLGHSLSHCTSLFDSIGGDHLNIISDYGWFRSTLNPPLPQEDFHTEFLLKYVTNPGFEVQLVQEKYGYILMPPLAMIGASPDSTNRKAQEMYDAIIALNDSVSLKGWIVDMRFNIGGHIAPMLTALYHLLGDHTVFTVLDKDFAVKEIERLKNGAYYENNKKETFIQPKRKPNTTIPVALITGLASASCGELVPVAFRHRKNVTFIGERTTGLLTANELVDLPFGVQLTLTMGYLADRRANYTKEINPTIKIEKEANFKDLAKDANVMEAIQFIDACGGF